MIGDVVVNSPKGASVSNEAFRRRDAVGGGRDDRAAQEVVTWVFYIVLGCGIRHSGPSYATG